MTLPENVMRGLMLVGVCVAAAAGCDSASVPPAAAAAAEKFGVGSVAPPILADHWLNGPAVPAFEPGTVYVLDFWAVWCGPCRRTLPHTDELAKKYAADKLKVIAVTTTDDRGNTVGAAKQYALGPMGGFAITVAICEKPTTDDAYMGAAGRNSIPCTFVIDRAGRVAFIGHPNELDDVLPRVLDGTWNGKASADEYARGAAEERRIFSAVGAAGPAAGAKLPRTATKAEKAAAAWAGRAATAKQELPALDQFRAAFPARAGKWPHALQSLTVLLAAGESARAKAEAAAFLARPDATADTLRTFVSAWCSPADNPGRVAPEMGVTAADRALALTGDADPDGLVAACRAYAFAGRNAEARAFGDKAVAKSPGAKDAVRSYLSDE